MTAVGNPEYAIDVQGLNKHFGDEHVVNNVSLQVRKGEIFGFLGPNGSGKTTTIRMMCGLLKPDSGTGACLGYDILRRSGEIKRNVGYMTQRFSFWDDMTITENLDFVARIYDLPNRRDVVRQTIADLGLSARAKRADGNNAWLLPPACCTTPDCNGGALRAEKRKAVAAYAEAGGVYQQTVLQVFREVADALRAIDHDAQALQSQSEAAGEAESAYQIAAQRYAVGGISQVALLDAQRQQIQTALNRVAYQGATPIPPRCFRRLAEDGGTKNNPKERG